MTNMTGMIWMCQCPECRGQEMYANMSDWWECPKCGLQISTAGEVIIQAQKGRGKFKEIQGALVSAMDYILWSADLRITADGRFYKSGAPQ